MLEIDGQPIDLSEMHHYTLRFVAPDARPSLYRDGRRVMRAWKLKLDADIPADPFLDPKFGGNANACG